MAESTKPRAALIQTEIPGPKSRQLFAQEQKYIAPGTQGFALFSGLVMERGEGATLTDVDGNRYIDFIAGINVAALGHSHPHWVKLMTEQIQKLSVGSFCSENRVKLTELLASVTPGDLNRVQFYSGGAEAVEAAIRLAKAHTKKYEVVGFWGGFHGKTGGVLGVLGSNFKHSLGPLMPGLFLTPYPDCYRCPFKMKYPECNFHCLDFAREMIKVETTNSIAAILVEPIQGTAGNIVPPPGAMRKIQEIAREFGALLISDEMITGFGRCGEWFGVNHDGVVPDIMTCGKGIAAGFPLSAVITSDRIANSPPWSNPSGSSSSYGGNPMGAAAGRASVETIRDQKLVENSRKVGALMLARFRDFERKFSFVDGVDGKGLMIRVELVKSKATRERLDRKVCEGIFLRAMRRGLLTMAYTSSFRVNPPLVLDEATAMEGMDLLEEAFAETERELKR
ncbi:MAG TPA: aspartate aminotransferase family protein [Candidatus Saccharimonadales bacterium]|nr:aspartate aminotransferase family protein [Candidatus Saccharimonadales bacterium]